MKGAKVFWGHLVLWAGGLLIGSFLLSWIARTLPQLDYAQTPNLAAWLSAFDDRYVRHLPGQVALTQRLIWALFTATYPAGVAASRFMEAPRRIWSFATAALLPAALLAFLLVGYVRPDAARADSPGMPAYRQHPDYLYFHQLPHAFSLLQAKADSVAAARAPKMWALNRDVARWMVASPRHPFYDATAGRALEYRDYIRSVMAQTALPAILALIGLLVGLWSRTTSARFARLQVWVGALILVWFLYWELTIHQPYGGFWYWAWHLPVNAVFPPLLLALPLAWTVFLARDRLFAPEAVPEAVEAPARPEPARA